MKVFVAVFLCLIPLFVESSLVGSKRCTWGPSYWCGSIQKSHECKAIDHCIKAVWTKHHHVAVSEGPFCVACTEAVNKLKQMLADKQTDAAIQKALDSECNQLGEASVQCKQLVKLYFPEIVKMLENDIDANQVCALFQLCTSIQKTIPATRILIAQPRSRFFSQVKPKVSATPECILCEFVLSGIDQALKDNATEHEIISAINNVCSILPSTIATECRDFVNQYGPAVLQLLAQEVNPKMVCSLLKLCTSSKHAIECNVCKDLLQVVNSMAQKPTTTILAKKALNHACDASKLSTLDKLMCYGFVADYEHLILPMVLKQIAPTKVCAQVQMCRQRKQK